jgi:hypothetical protein
MKYLQLKQFSIRRLAIILLLVIATLIGFLLWKIFDSTTSFDIALTDVYSFGPVGECYVPLYDSQGNSHPVEYWSSIESLTYTGPAPLFLVDPSNYSDESNGDPCWYPERISSDIAVNGVKVYPFVLTVNLVNSADNVRKGESTKLSAEAKLLDEYPVASPDNSVMVGVAVESTSIPDVYFALDTTTFEFTPPNEPINTSSLSLSRPTHQDWIISPEADTLGEQSLSVHIFDKATNDSLADADILITVREISGINPTFVAILGSSSTFLLGLFAILKAIPEAWALWKPTRKKMSKSKN